MPESLGYTVLCDFGSAVSGDQVNTADAQPDAYRSPEMMLGIPWSYPIDIWNVGCMVWDLCQGGHLFEYRDPANNYEYRSKVHMASIISPLGPPPPELVDQCTVKNKFLTLTDSLTATLLYLPREHGTTSRQAGKTTQKTASCLYASCSG